LGTCPSHECDLTVCGCFDRPWYPVEETFIYASRILATAWIGMLVGSSCMQVSNYNHICQMSVAYLWWSVGTDVRYTVCASIECLCVLCIVSIKNFHVRHPGCVQWTVMYKYIKITV
jgi:hypothetical protein